MIVLVGATLSYSAPVLVTNTNDNLAGSLRQAIESDSNPGDTILFQIPTSDSGYDPKLNSYVVTLTTNSLLIDHDLIIDAGGQKILVVRDSGAHFRILKVTGSKVTISGLALYNGNATNTDGLSGGGILNEAGTLTLNNCTIGSNDGSSFGGGIFNFGGGTIIVNSCTFRDNSASYGGGIMNYATGQVTINSSTFFHNTSTSQQGGAIFDDGRGVTISNSTIVANTAFTQGGGVYANSSFPAHVRNTIIARNTCSGSATSVDVFGSFISDGYNFIGVFNDEATGFGNAGSHDQVGSSGSPADPQLDILQNNGGPTWTMRPFTGSPVIDQGSSGGVANDQRGQPRRVEQPGVNNVPGGDGSDIGAVENGLPQSGTTLTVTTTGEHADSSGCTIDDCTFLEALNAANANADANTIVFAPAVRGTIYTGVQAGLNVVNPVTIVGPGARQLLIDGQGFARILATASPNIFISGLTLYRGFVGSGDGGAIYNTGGLTVSDCNFLTNAVSSGNGGGIFNVSGATLNLVRCTVNANTAVGQYGGGVYNDGTFTATNCTFILNEAIRGGGIISRFNNGVSSTTLRNCTISSCIASSTGTTSGDGGGGIYAEGGAQQYHFSNTIIAGNTSGSNPEVNPDVRGNITSDGHNFIGIVGFSSGLTDGTNGDQVGSSASPKDPKLDGLANNGGETDTFALLGPSTAINAGDNKFAPVTDQRGYSRNGVSDIGAYEFNGTLPVLKLLSIVRLANGHTSLQGTGVVSSAHEIQAASEPGSFTFIGTATSNSVGALQYDDAGADGLTKRFYQLTFP